MTDRELLEAAARGAGLGVAWRDSAGCVCYTSSPYEVAWNPLTDDGDALRLAAALGICIDFAGGWTAAYAGSRAAMQFSERHGSDPYAATRRAIVRAAASLGAPGA